MLLFLAAHASLNAEKTDVIILQNGDRITGEIRKLARGRLEYSTDDMRTLQIEWLKVDFIQSRFRFEIESNSGRRYIGSIERAGEKGNLVVVTDNAKITLELRDVINIDPLGVSFIKRLKGYLDLGLSFERSSSLTTWTTGAELNYRVPKWNYSAVASSYIRTQEDITDTLRNNLNLSISRLFQNRWIGSGFAFLQQNNELNLDFRMLLGLAGGRYIVQTNDMLLSLMGGLNFTSEKFSESDDVQKSAEALVMVKFETFRFVAPELDFMASLLAFPSLTERGRVRTDFNSRLRYELFNNFFITLSVFHQYDGDLRGQGERSADFGFDTRVTWSFK